MDTIRFILNGKPEETNLPAGFSVLDFLRKKKKMTGTKEGCREGECGACSVLIGENDKGKTDYRVFTSCLLTLGHIRGKHLVTIEGLNRDELNPIQKLMVENFGIQCGYCTPGLIVAITGFMINSENLSLTDAVDALDGNICRCTGYVGIRAALKKLCSSYAKKLEGKDRISRLIEYGILPEYFAEIPATLAAMANKNKPERLIRGKDTILLAGGTDLMVQDPETLKEASLKYISDFPSLKGINLTKTSIDVGAGVRMSDFQKDETVRKHYPAIDEYFSLVASAILRSEATFAGNIVNASPTGDLSILLLAMRAGLVISDGRARREVKLRNFFRGFKSIDLKKNEYIERIRIPIPHEGHLFSFEKVAFRKHLDIAVVNTAMGVSMDKGRFAEVTISAGGVESYPKTLEKTATFLVGKTPTVKNIKAALDVMASEINPRSGKHGSKEYKSLLARNLLIAHFIKLFPERLSFEDLT